MNAATLPLSTIVKSKYIHRLAVAIVLTATAQAGPIVFGPATTIATPADVLTAGTGVFAYNWSNTTAAVNGVTFASTTATTTIGSGLSIASMATRNPTPFTSTAAPFSALNAAYKSILIGALYSNTNNANGTVTLGSLTEGHQYAVQLWVSDPRTSVRTENVIGANTVLLDFDTKTPAAAGGLGTFTIGIFTAAAGPASFVIDPVDLLIAGKTFLPQINAIQLRDITNLGWWSGVGGSTWDAATTPNFSTDAVGTLGTFDQVKTAGPLVSFADTQTFGGADVATSAVNIAAGGATGANVTFLNSTKDYTLTSADTTGITGNFGVSLQGGGTVTFAGSNTYTGATTISSGLLVLSSGTAINDIATVTLANDATASLRLDASETIGALSGGGAVGGNVNIQGNTLTVGDVADSTFAGIVSGLGGTVVKQGTGALTLSGANTFTGGTTVNNGTLTIGHSSALGSGGFTLTNGTVNLGTTVAQPATLNQAGGTLNLSLAGAAVGGFAVSGNATFAGGTINVTLSGAPSALTYDLVTYGGELTGTPTFAVAGDFGRLVPVITNPAGKFVLGLTGTVANLKWTGATNDLWNNNLTDNFTNGGTADVFRSLDNVLFDDTTEFTSPQLVGSIVAGVVTFDHSAKEYILGGTGALAAATALVKTGTGTLTISSANTFTGSVTINGGLLKLGNPGALGPVGTKTITINAGGQLDFAGVPLASTRAYTYRIAGDGSGKGGALVNNSTATLGSNAGIANLELLGDATVGSNSTGEFHIALNGTITGNSHTLTKVGANQIQLRGPATDLTLVVDGGTLGLETSALAFGGAAGMVTVNPGAVLGAFGAHTIATPLRLNEGSTLRALGGGSTEWTGNITLGGDATVDLATGQATTRTTTISGNIGETAGSHSLIKGSGNRLNLTGTNSYTGGTRLEGGILAGTGAAGSLLTAATGTTLAPGIGIGTFLAAGTTLGTGATLAIEIDSTTGTADKLVSTAAVEISNSGVSFTEIGSGTLPAGTKLVILDYTGTTLTGTFTGYAEGAQVAVGANTFTLSYADSSRVTLTSPTVASGYPSWAANPVNGLTAGGNDGPAQDPDHDGIANVLEYVLGGKPMSASPAILPTAGNSGASLIFTYNRSDDSKFDSTQMIEYGNNLSGWTAVNVPAASSTVGGLAFAIDEGTPATNPDTVVVTIPNDGNPKFFVRLKVTTP